MPQSGGRDAVFATGKAIANDRAAHRQVRPGRSRHRCARHRGRLQTTKAATSAYTFLLPGQDRTGAKRYRDAHVQTRRNPMKCRKRPHSPGDRHGTSQDLARRIGYLARCRRLYQRPRLGPRKRRPRHIAGPPARAGGHRKRDPAACRRRGSRAARPCTSARRLQGTASCQAVSPGRSSLPAAARQPLGRRQESPPSVTSPSGNSGVGKKARREDSLRAFSFSAAARYPDQPCGGLRPAASSSGRSSSHRRTRWASTVRMLRPSASISTITSGCPLIHACITRQRPASLI